jgi:hypothetical protein
MTNWRTGGIGSLLLGLAWTAVAAAPGLAADATIENARLRVVWSRETGEFSVVDKATGREFLRRGRLNVDGDEPVVAIFDDRRGSGQEIAAVNLNRGDIDSVTLLEDQPFILVQSTLANRGAEPTITNSIRTLTTAVETNSRRSAPADCCLRIGILAAMRGWRW